MGYYRRYSFFIHRFSNAAKVVNKRIPRGFQPTKCPLRHLLSSLGSLVQARFPKGSAPDSRDYLPTLLGKDLKGRNYVIGQSNTHVLSVLTAQYRYIEPSNGPKMIQWGPKIETGNLPVPQLYDMTVSPFESKNVADEHSDEVSRMQLILKEERNK